MIYTLISCNPTKNLKGKTFKYESKQRTMELTFENDSLCIFKNVFHCKDISPEIKTITFNCKYRRESDYLFVKNLIYDSLCNNVFVDIPPQNSTCCTFLTNEKRKKVFYIGPSYLTDYEKYGLVPNIGIDTLIIVKNKIWLFKHTNIMTAGFIFK